MFSGMDVTDTEGTVGLYVHELLHNLGVGNTPVLSMCHYSVLSMCPYSVHHPGWAHAEAA